MEHLINATVRLKDDVAAATGWPKGYGTVVDETETKARVQWPTAAGMAWVEKRDLLVLG